jgi:hypothetical protein
MAAVCLKNSLYQQTGYAIVLSYQDSHGRSEDGPEN